ncbi:MAG TPA: response regulator [Nevskiaceae bacterium]|nr:response regulator [Nevskiaceae bacterium]
MTPPSADRPIVLVVDDQAMNLAICEAILSDRYEIECAGSGAQALEKVAARAPDLIMLDVMMPEMDGYEVCRRLKADPSTARIPVIFLTGKHEIEDEIQGFALGCVDYIGKPFNAALVLARLDVHLKLAQREKRLTEKLRELGLADDPRFLDGPP